MLSSRKVKILFKDPDSLDDGKPLIKDLNEDVLPWAHMFGNGNDLDENGSPLAETDAEQEMSAVKRDAMKLVAEFDDPCIYLSGPQLLQELYIHRNAVERRRRIICQESRP
jgi:hypothetical protein